MKKLFSKEKCTALLLYFILYAAAILVWELLLVGLRTQNLLDMQPYYQLFVPAQALLLAALSGWLPNRTANRVVQTLPILALLVFYEAQAVYYSVFGSYISVTLVGLGADAVESFAWSMWDALKPQIGWYIALLVPALALLGITWFGESRLEHARPAVNVAALVLAVGLWFGASGLLIAFGTGEDSPFNACHDSMTDTDTTAEAVGVLTCSSLEFGLSMPDYGVYERVVAEREERQAALLAEQAAAAEERRAREEEERAAAEALGIVEPEPEETLDTSPHVIEGLDFAALAEMTENAKIKDLCEYFAEVEPTNRNEYTGMLEGYNLVYICAESFSTPALNETITPTLYKLANEGIVLTNYYNCFKNTTTNGEFAFNTGLWPDVSRDADSGSSVGTMAQSYKNYLPYALGNVFKDEGVDAWGYHNYIGRYYARNRSLPNMGYNCKFKGEGMSFTTSWPTSDYEMMQQTVDDFINEDRFMAYYMTFSGHGSYTSDNVICSKNIGFVNQVLKGKNYCTNARYYLAGQVELDKAMEYLLQRLEQAGKLENTLIVLTGDHNPYYLHLDGMRDIMGRTPESSFEAYESTCIMWVGSMSEPLYVDAPCCTVDILPTVLNLLNLDYDSRLLAGRDILSDCEHMAVLYNKNFITDQVKYQWSKGKATWLTEGGAPADSELYIANLKNQVTARYAMSLKVVSTDFYRFLWDNAAVLQEQPEETAGELPEPAEGLTPETEAPKTNS